MFQLELGEIVRRQRDYFSSGKTREISWRVERLKDLRKAINGRPKPLSLYFFSRNRGNQERVLRETSSGGVCIDDTIIHLATRTLPFGGV